MSARKRSPKAIASTPFATAKAQKLRHLCFILVVGTGPGQGNGPQREAERCRLQFQQLAPDGVHGDAIELFVEGSDESYDFDARILPEEMQRPGAVFTARPRERYALQARTGDRSLVATVRLSQAYRPNRTAV